MLRQTTF